MRGTNERERERVVLPLSTENEYAGCTVHANSLQVWKYVAI